MLRTSLLIIGLVLLASPGLLLKGDTTGSASVGISRAGFDPASVTIKIGDSVTWSNNDDRDHDVTATDGSFHSGNLKPGASFIYSFSQAGQFPYACTLHPRETGMVIVQNK